MSNIMKQLRDLHEYLDDFLRSTDTELAILMKPDNFEFSLYDSRYYFQLCKTKIALLYDGNWEVNELGDMIIEKYNYCVRNCNWCVHMTSEGCELGKGDANDDTNKI